MGDPDDTGTDWLVGQPKADDEDVSDSHDDASDHTKCKDCRGKGVYEGLNERRKCPTCAGAGWL